MSGSQLLGDGRLRGGHDKPFKSCLFIMGNGDAQAKCSLRQFEMNTDKFNMY